MSRSTSRQPWLVGSMLCMLCTFVCAFTVEAATHYELRLGLAQFTGDSLRLSFELTSGDTLPNVAKVLSLQTDSRTRTADRGGGPVSGVLFETGPPGSGMVWNGSFLNQIAVPLDSVGLWVSGAVELSEQAGAPGQMADELSFFVLRANGFSAFPTLDPLATDALFAIDITGQGGGDLSVFAPMQFVPPDTLKFTNSVVSVPLGLRVSDRLRFLATSPNPFRNDVRLTYHVPIPGGRLRVRVYDVSGRVVAEPFNGHIRPGDQTLLWDGRDMRGRDLRAGVFLIELKMAGQTVVRRAVLAR